MTITITLDPAVGAMGPASLFRASSSIVDPGPLPWTWIWDFIETVDNRTILSTSLSSSTAGPIAYRYMYNQDLATPSALVHSNVMKDGTPMRVNVRLVNDLGQQVDTGTLQTIPWQTSIQQHFDLLHIAGQGQGQGGFTAEDRQTVEATKTDTTGILAQWANYTGVTLPSLDQVLANIDAKLIAQVLTASGPVGFPIGQLLNFFDPKLLENADLSGGVTCERIDADVSFNALYGVTVRIATYPVDWHFRTPDLAWSFRDLAVLSFRRGGDLVERHGIHTITHSVSPIPDSALFSLGPIFGYLQPGDYHISVDWAEGVCGELLGMVLP